MPVYTDRTIGSVRTDRLRVMVCGVRADPERTRKGVGRRGWVGRVFFKSCRSREQGEVVEDRGGCFGAHIALERTLGGGGRQGGCLGAHIALERTLGGSGKQGKVFGC